MYARIGQEFVHVRGGWVDEANWIEVLKSNREVLRAAGKESETHAGHHWSSSLLANICYVCSVEVCACTALSGNYYSGPSW